MNPTDQPRGNFKMNLNFRRKGNDKAPPITGSISTPEEPEVSYSFSAFAQHSDKGRYWIGPVETNRSLRQALTTDQAPRGTHFVAIRENGFKVFKELDDGTQNPTYLALNAEQRQKEDAKPAFWATWTRTDAEPQLRAAAWERDPSRYGPWASGNVQHPLTKEQIAAMDAERGHPDMVDEPAPAPRATKGRSSASHERA